MCLDLLCYHLTQNVAFEKCTSNLCWIMLHSCIFNTRKNSTLLKFGKVRKVTDLALLGPVLTLFWFEIWVTWIQHNNICHDYKKQIFETTFLLSLDLSKSRFFVFGTCHLLLENDKIMWRRWQFFFVFLKIGEISLCLLFLFQIKLSWIWK